MSDAFLLDTNVLVRFLVGDNTTQQSQAQEWFKEAQRGKRTIVVTPIVIAETSFVLESYYKQSRDGIASALEVFVAQKWLDVEDRVALQQLWSDYRRGLHFVDSYLLARAHRSGSPLLTFDRQLGKR